MGAMRTGWSKAAGWSAGRPAGATGWLDPWADGLPGWAARAWDGLPDRFGTAGLLPRGPEGGWRRSGDPATAPLEGGGADHVEDHEGTVSGTADAGGGGTAGLAAGTRTVAPTGDAGIDGLLRGVCWADPAVTYCDPDGLEDYDPAHPKGLLAEELTPLTAQQLDAVRFALDADPFGALRASSAFAVEGFTNLAVAYAGSGTGAGTIPVINRSSTTTASAYYPNGASWGGDVFLGGSGGAPMVGNYDWKVVLHELGHALGLKHGQDVSVYGALPTALDTMEYSVMTYRSYVGMTVGGGYTNEDWGYAQTFMILDIAALQQMYGADYGANAGDTTYRWTPTSGATLIDGVVALQPGANRIFMTVWDGGGHDTYDLSAYTQGVSIDLAPGGHSVLSQAQLADLDDGSSDGARVARGNVFNALLFGGDTASLIEDAIGGSGHDTIRGNEAANRLVGGAGDDTLIGAAGRDVLVGGAGRDTLQGGADGDVFVFAARTDSAVGSRRDVVLDFTAGDDRLDLSAIDARPGTAADDAFAWGGRSAGAYRVWWTSTTDGVLLRGDVTGDRKADFEILLKGITGLAADDLLL